MTNKIYLAIDLKSFYASVECRDRNLDPMTSCLVVADAERTEKTICLAATPAMKSMGFSSRARLFEVNQKLKEINQTRKLKSPYGRLIGKSNQLDELNSDPSLEMSYIAAVPRMTRYMEVSAQIVDIYLKYVASEDMHVYSIDEVFIDLTPYLNHANMSAREYASMMIQEVYKKTGITATAGIGTNLYLCKVALDILAKRADPDEFGVRIAELNEISYRKNLWNHQPLTDFWRIGHGISKKLEENGIYTMGDLARCSIGKQNEYYNEELLYQCFGVNAELLIDHAWGFESCTMKDIKSYKPSSNSLGTGQVLHCAYTSEKARLVVQEMAEQLALDLLDKGFVSNHFVLTVGYDIENLKNSKLRKFITSEIKTDFYGRKIPKHAHGTTHLPIKTSSITMIVRAFTELYDQIVDSRLLMRRIMLTACNIVPESQANHEYAFDQISLFSDFSNLKTRSEKEKITLEKEKSLQKTMLEIKRKYGKNKLIKLMNCEEGATMVQRNEQIGGHRA